ncbi:MAG: metal-dependent phosphohydrolase [Leptospiraceae bacterium]|nr:MAG: metal-dependent phosphohydrolase [Leptospiraceae bacterium]
MATSRKKKTIKIEDLKPGMVFTSPLYIDDENILVRANEPIKKTDIEKLLKWGIDVVYTDGDLIIEQNKELKKNIESKGNKVLQELDDIKLHKDYAKLKDFKEEFQERIITIGSILRRNFKDLVEKKQFNNHEILSEALYLTNQIVEYRFFPLLLLGIRISDDVIVHHSIHTACYGGYLGKLINLSKVRIQDLVFAIMLMDVGMYFIPPQLRQKNYPLTEKERRVFYAHTIYGYKVLKEDAYVKQPLALVALQHHENFDGTGYPRKLKKEEISLMARIAAVVDRYAAMIEDRYHRTAKMPYEAMKVLLSQEASHLDPRILRFFVGGMSAYPIGSYVLLSNNYKALVVEGNIQSPLRPLVKLLFDDSNKIIEDLKFLDLTKEPTVTITKVLNPKNEGLNISQLI